MCGNAAQKGISNFETCSKRITERVGRTERKREIVRALGRQRAQADRSPPHPTPTSDLCNGKLNRILRSSVAGRTLCAVFHRFSQESEIENPLIFSSLPP